MYSKVGFVLALFTTMLWGTLPVVIKPLLASMSTITITWYRYAVSAILLTAFLRWRGKLPIPADLRSIAPWLVGAVICFAGNNLLFLAGLNYVGPSAAEVVIQLAPVVLILAGILIFKEPFSVLQWLGIATPAELDVQYEAMKVEVEDAVERARNAPWPDVSTLFDHV